MSKKKQRKSRLNYGKQKIKRGNQIRSFDNTRAEVMRRRAVALRNARMRLLTPLQYLGIEQTKAPIYKDLSMAKPVSIKDIRTAFTIDRSPTTVIRERKNPCQAKAQRRAVLLAKGKVQKSGGAPGPYSKHRIKCK